jgi:hypothetical protein
MPSSIFTTIISIAIMASSTSKPGRDEDDEPEATLALREERMVVGPEDGREVGEDLVDLLGVRARGERRVLGALELRRGDELHRAGDLLDVLHGADPAPDIALGCHQWPLSSVTRGTSPGMT